ncbi:hypothetical protein ACOME3_002055 [Neoechinorhynchus agilis]
MSNAKLQAARAAVDIILAEKFDVIGIGSGTTLSMWIKEFHCRLDPKRKERIKCVPTSYQSKLELLSYGFRVFDPISINEIDVAIDGADEVDHELVCIKGGGGCHFQEMLVAKMSKKYYIVVDSSKVSRQLGEKWKHGVPVEVLPTAFKYVQSKIKGELGGNCEIRTGSGKMGPVITDNGNFILDWVFDKVPEDWGNVYSDLKFITGVVEVGLFAGIIDAVLSADENGMPVCLQKTP